MGPFAAIMYQSNRSFNIQPPGIPRAFDAFSCPWGRAFDHHSYGVGNLIASLDFMLQVTLISQRQRRQTLMNSKEKIVYLWWSGWISVIFDLTFLPSGREFDSNFLENVKIPPYAPPPPRRLDIERCIRSQLLSLKASTTSLQCERHTH